jgi:ABC-type multidrug transport system fused ATPase/permease subunit
MTVEEACELLDVQPDASEEEIGSGFRRAARSTHTDAPGGNRADWDRVVEARDILLGQHPGQTLVRIDVAKELVRSQSEAIERLEQRNERAAATASALQSVTLRHTSSLDRRKRSAWMAGAAAAALGTLITVIRTVAISGTGTTETVAIAAFMAGAYFGAGALAIWGFVLQFRAEQLTHAIEDVTAQLSRRANYLQALNEIRQTSELPDEWLIDDFEHAIDDWADATASSHPSSLASTAREIGSRDFGELVISKGLELDVLDESTYEDDGELFVTHAIKLKDSHVG